MVVPGSRDFPGGGGGSLPNPRRPPPASARAICRGCTIRVSGALAASFGADSPAACNRPAGSWGARVAITGRLWVPSGGFDARPGSGTRLAATGLMPRCPRTGWSFCRSPGPRRVSRTRPRPNWSRGTPITALRTFMFWNLLMAVTFTILVLLMTTLFTMRGPYQPPQKGLPMKPTGPHHGSTGSPNPSATHPNGGTGMPTFTDTPTGPTKPTRAGA